MNATVHFYHNATDCVLSTPRTNGGTTHTLFESVSQCWQHIRDNGLHVTQIITHHEDTNIAAL